MRRVQNKIDYFKKERHVFPKSWKGARKINSKKFYDDKKHASFGSITLANESAGNIVFAAVELLGDHKIMTSMTFIWSGEDAESFLDLVYETVDSFEYDEGYRFGKSKYGLKIKGIASTDGDSFSAGSGQTVVEFIVSTLIFVVCLWIGMIITGEQGSFLMLIFISVVASLLGLIPVVGFILAPIAMYVLICKLLAIETWPDAVLMVIVANFIEGVASFFIIANYLN